MYKSLVGPLRRDGTRPVLPPTAGNEDARGETFAILNVRNALYDMGNFRDSAQAYIQALRLNPADHVAKHNLELSLNKMQQQEQRGQDQEQNSNQSKPEGSGQSGKNNEPKVQDKQEQPSQPQDKTSQKPASPQPMPSEQSQGTFSRERALQILDALQNQELAEQRRLLEQKARTKTSVRIGSCQGEGSSRSPRSAGCPHPLPAIMPASQESHPDAGQARVGSRCARAPAPSRAPSRIWGRQRIAGLSAAQEPIPARQFAACPE